MKLDTCVEHGTGHEPLCRGGWGRGGGVHVRRIDAARRRLAQAREEAAAGPAAAHVAEAITPALDVLNSKKYRKKLIDSAADAPPA